MARCVKSVSDINEDMGLTVRHSGLVIAAGWRAKMNKNRLNGTYLDENIKKAQSVAVKSGLPAEVDEDDAKWRRLYMKTEEDKRDSAEWRKLQTYTKNREAFA
ncbi:hypothetical protein B0H13DRAFT_1887204 [Mycena leptocephala]|nr:hypothetical protein B0H13DRAFT_1887204 [Mycena leptocephala]